MPSPNPKEDAEGKADPCGCSALGLSVFGSHVGLIMNGRVRSLSARAYSPVWKWTWASQNASLGSSRNSI